MYCFAYVLHKISSNNLAKEKNKAFNTTVGLWNFTKLVILSVVLSDTCLLATQIWHIEVAFKTIISESTRSETVALYIRVYYSDTEIKDGHTLGDGIALNPLDSNGKIVDWADFSEGKFANYSGNSRYKWAYEEWLYDPYDRSLFTAQSNNDDGLTFQCGHFQIFFDKHGHIQINGGSQGDRFIITKFDGLNVVTDGVQPRPIVIAEGKEIKCSLLFVEAIDTFINKGSSGCRCHHFKVCKKCRKLWRLSIARFYSCQIIASYK